MDKDVYEKILSLHENNQKIKDLLEKEANELKELIVYKHLDDTTREAFATLLHSLQELEQENEAMDLFYQEQISYPPVSFGIIYPKSRDNIYQQLLPAFINASSYYKINIVLFSIEDVNVKDKTVAGTVISGSTAKHSICVIPPFIYNCTIHSKTTSLKKMKQLRKLDTCHVVNSMNTFQQSVCFDILSSFPDIQPYIRNYDVFSPSKIECFLEKEKSVFLIPEEDMKLKHAISVEKHHHSYCLLKNGSTDKIDKTNLYQIMNDISKKGTYIMMEGTTLGKWLEMPIEIRVYLQKTDYDNWSITDMVAKSEFFSTTAKYPPFQEQLSWVLTKQYPEKRKDIIDLLSEVSTNTSKYLNYYISGLGSLTIDFIMDPHGKIYLFYVKGWENKTFLRKVHRQSWNRYVTNSIHYLYNLYHRALEAKEEINGMD